MLNFYLTYPQRFLIYLYPTLLVQDESLAKNHEKLYRDLVNGNIKLKNESYLIRTNENKRIYIYDENNVLVAT